MTQDSADTSNGCFTIIAADKGATPPTVEAFLISKLGATVGTRFYKELVAAAKPAAKQAGTFPAILLDVPGGEFAALSRDA